MSSLWTPGGEKPVGNNQNENENRLPEESMEDPNQSAGIDPLAGFSEEQLEQMRQQLIATPASVVVANHCFGLFELASLHLSLEQPQLVEARVAIDALQAIVEKLEGRLGETEPQLREGVSQLRMAFVKIRNMAEGKPENQDLPTE